MAEPIHVIICAHCGKGFLSEDSILDHQSHFQRLHDVDPVIEEHDGNPWDGAIVDVGRSYTWEPYSSHAREECMIFAISGNGDESRIVTDAQRSSRCVNSLSRFVEAVWPARPMTPEQRVRVVVAERELGIEEHLLDDGLADALQDGLGDRQNGRIYKPRDDMELMVLSIVETREIKRMVSVLLEHARGLVLSDDAGK